uniref:VWFA domain-containing protein n=1 Tax=Acrobeloides nanus TaxID=290746 RepID=A0A914DPC5_9BILA
MQSSFVKVLAGVICLVLMLTILGVAIGILAKVINLDDDVKKNNNNVLAVTLQNTNSMSTTSGSTNTPIIMQTLTSPIATSSTGVSSSTQQTTTMSTSGSTNTPNSMQTSTSPIAISSTGVSSSTQQTTTISPTSAAECSMDALSAYLDVILLIDTSNNMGSSNLQQIANITSSILQKFSIGNQPAIQARNTRVAVVTYDTQATIVANYTNINSIGDVSNLLNGLSVSTHSDVNIYDAFVKANYIMNSCTDIGSINCSFNPYNRPEAIVLFASAIGSTNTTNLINLVIDEAFFDTATVITANFNQQDTALTTILNNITYNIYVNTSMYNLNGNSTSFKEDLEWAILQED